MKSVIKLIISNLFFQLVLYVFPMYIIGQNTEIDSLWKMIKVHKEDSAHVNTLNRLSYKLILYNNYQKADSIAQLALTLSTKTNFKKGILIACRNLGLAYFDKGDYKKALDFQLQSLKMSKVIGSDVDIGCAYGNIGNIYYHEGNYLSSTVGSEAWNSRDLKSRPH